MRALSKVRDTEAVWPGSAEEALGAAAAAAAQGTEIVVAMGGDGMVHHLAQALIGTETALGIIPSGTTNVIARLLGIPTRPVRAAKLIRSAESAPKYGTVKMDLQQPDGRLVRHALFACGVGLDAEVVRMADADPYRKYRFGSLHYARSAFSVALGDFSKSGDTATVTIDGETMAASTVLAQFRSVYTFFGRRALRFGERLPDPMTALVMSDFKRRRVPQIGLRALTGRRLDAVQGIRILENADEIEITAHGTVAAQADGEGLGLIESATLSWTPESLRMITGRHPSG